MKRSKDEVKQIISKISEELLEACDSGDRTFQEALDAGEKYWALQDKEREAFRGYCRMHRKIFGLYKEADSGCAGFKSEDFARYEESAREDFAKLTGSDEEQQKNHDAKNKAMEYWIDLVEKTNEAEDHFKEMRTVVQDRIVEMRREESNKSR